MKPLFTWYGDDFTGFTDTLEVLASDGIDTLTFAGPLAPGSPMCRAASRDPALDGLEITLKGGRSAPTKSPTW